MTTYDTHSDRRFFRDKDRAILGGVCAGLAEYLGFNLKVTRCLAIIAFLMAMPIAIIAYFAAVFLIPSESRRNSDNPATRRFGRRRQSKKEKDSVEPAETSIAAAINRRCESLDGRLRRLEKQVTSKRFQLDQELSRL